MERYAKYVGTITGQHLHLGAFAPDEVLPYRISTQNKVKNKDAKKLYSTTSGDFMVNMKSQRFDVFAESLRCVECGIIGVVMMLDSQPSDKRNQAPHFNLYAEAAGELILMTKDHIVPKSNGGPNHGSNYQTMCSECNNSKRSHYTGTIHDLIRSWDCDL